MSNHTCMATIVPQMRLSLILMGYSMISTILGYRQVPFQI